MRYSTSDEKFVTRRTLVIYFAPLSTADEAHAACTKVTSMLRSQYISSEVKEVEIVQCTTTPLADKDARRGPIDTVPWIVVDDFTDELETDGARVTLAVCSALAQDKMQVPSALVVRKMGDYFSDFSFVPADDISAIWQQENMAAEQAVAEEAEDAAAAEEGEAEEQEIMDAEKPAVAEKAEEEPTAAEEGEAEEHEKNLSGRKREAEEGPAAAEEGEAEEHENLEAEKSAVAAEAEEKTTGAEEEENAESLTKEAAH
jgi:hypothetical protein